MRCPRCDEFLKFAVRFDYEEAIDYVFDGLVEDGYVPHRDEIEVLMYHLLDYLVKVGFLDSGQFTQYGDGI